MSRASQTLDYAAREPTRPSHRPRPVLAGMSVAAGLLMVLTCVFPTHGTLGLLEGLGRLSAVLSLSCAVLGGLGAVRRERPALCLVAVLANLGGLALWLSIGGKSYFGGSP